MSLQNRLFCIAGGLLLALSLPGCTKSEIYGSNELHDILICLTISPGPQDSYTYSFSKTHPPNPPTDKIGLNSATGDVDLTRLVVTRGDPKDPRRPVKITYSFDSKWCPATNGQYSFYFTNRNYPLVPKSNDPQDEFGVDPFIDRATQVTVHYKNHPNDSKFPFFIDYTWKKIATGELENRRTVDPNITNTP